VRLSRTLIGLALLLATNASAQETPSVDPGVDNGGVQAAAAAEADSRPRQTPGAIAVRVSDEYGVPVEGAVVRTYLLTVTALGEPKLTPAGSDNQHTQRTDDRGRIRFYDPIGRQRNSAQRRGNAGNIRTFYPGVLDPAYAQGLELLPGGELTLDIVIARPFAATPPRPEGAIAVHVTDESGNPRANVEVRVLTVNAPQLRERREFYTDDRGDARIYGLPAGDYILLADPPATAAVATAAGPTPAVATAAGATLAVDADRADQDLIYLPIYFPGSPTLAGAHVLTVQPWNEINVDIALAPVKAAHVSGRVVKWDGDPGRASVVLSLNPAGLLSPDGLVSGPPRRATLVRGEFRFDNIAPGDYIIRTSGDPRSRVRDGVAEVAITVDGQDISDLILETVPER
jgi:hypothetical protein